VGECLAVVGLHHVHDEPCYVARRSDGSTVPIPAGMTEIAAGNAQIVAEPRPPLAVLLELRRWVPTVPS
jgi:hypothetical protein